MIFKNKKLFLKIYIPFVIITIITLIILQILGSKNRIGYLTDFNLNIDRTLELNNLNDIRKEFTIGGKSDEESITNQVRKMKYYDFKNIDKAEIDEEGIKNYIFTNENITNYIYHFRIRYYDKTFRNNYIYGVYPDLSNLPDYIKNAEMDEDGSPYGNFISDKKEIEEKIDNVNYVLKIKFDFCLILISVIILIFLTNNINIFNYSSLRPVRLDYILFGIIVGLCFFSYIYSDVLVIFPFSVNFWNVNPVNFFYEVYNKVGSYHKPDDLPYLAYVIYAMLYFPLWIYSKVRGITYYTWHHPNFEVGTLEIMYIKFLLLFFVLASSYLLYKISKKLGLYENRSKWVGFIFISSPFTILPAFVISQVEIIMIFFTLLAISDYLDNNRRYILWFSIAIPLKLFPIFIFIPLTLLREKNYIKIIINIIIVILPYIITQIIFKSPNPSNRNIIALQTIVDFKIIGASIFIIIYGFICLYSFLQNKDSYDKYEFNRLVIYTILFTFSLVVLVNSFFHLYWIIIISPFISLVIFFNDKYFKLNILLEFIATFCYALMLSYSHTFITMGEATRTKSIPFIKLFVKSYKYNNIRDIFPNIFQNANITNIIYSLFVTAIICILIINFPKNNKSLSFDSEKPIDRKIYIRFIPTLFIIFLIWYLGIKK